MKQIRYTGIQPQYFPRLHYFARILNTDIFMIRDDAQFVKKHKYPDGHNGPSYQAHTPIKTASGTLLLQVPFVHEGYKPLFDTQISYSENWQGEHLKTVKIAYSNAPHFKKIYPEIEELISKKYNSISDLSTTTTFWGILKLLGEKIDQKNLQKDKVLDALSRQKKFRLKQIKKGSESKAIKETGLSPSEKIIRLIKEVGANTDYCGGTGVAAYLNLDEVKKNNITILVQDWKCKEYYQRFAKIGFISNLSIIDLLMNVSIEEAVDIIKGNEG